MNTSNGEEVWRCAKCDQVCEVISIHGSDTEEFWGAPVQRPWSEDASECCEAEVYPDEEEKETPMPAHGLGIQHE